MKLREILAGMTGKDEGEAEIDELLDTLGDIGDALQSAGDRLESIADLDLEMFGISSADLASATYAVSYMLMAVDDAEDMIRDVA